MQPNSRRWRRVFGVLLAIFIALILVLRTERAGGFVCEQLREGLPAVLGAQVSLGRCAIDPLTARVEVTDVSVTANDASSPLLVADKAAVSLRGFFWGGVSFQDIEVMRPRIEVALSPPEAPSGTCPLNALSRLRIGRLRVVDGNVVLKFPEGRSLQLDGLTVDASLGRQEASVTLDGRGGALMDGERTLRLGKLVLEGALDVEDAQVAIQRAEANVEGVRLTITGSIDALCEPSPTLDLAAQAWVPLAAVARFGIELPSASGQMLARARVTGKTNAPAVQVNAEGSRVTLGDFSPGDFSVKGSFNGKVIKLEDLTTHAGDGEIHVSGEMSLEPGWPVTAHIETVDASFARVLSRAGVAGAWVEFPVTVNGSVAGTLRPTPSLQGDVEFKTGRFTLAARPWDGPASAGVDILKFEQSSGRFRLGITPQAVSFDDIAIRAGVADATRVSGAVKLFVQRGGIDLDINADAIDLSDFGSIAQLPMSGVGTAQVTVKGPFQSIVVAGHASLRDFDLRGYSLGVVQSPLGYQDGVLSFPSIAAQKGQTQYFGDVALHFNDSGLHTRATVQLPDGRVEDVVDLLANLSPTIQNLQGGVLRGRTSALVAIDSPASALTGLIVAQVRDVHFFDRRLGESSLMARFDGGEALVLEPTFFEGPLGHLSVDGRWNFAGPLDFRLGVDGGALAELIDPNGAREIPVGGRFFAHAQVSGTTDEMHLDGDVSSSGVSWKERALGPLRLSAKVIGRELKASGTLFPGVDGVLDMTMANDWPFRSKLTLALEDVSAFLPQEAASVAMHVKGMVEARGPLLDLGQVKAHAQLTDVGLSRGEVSARNVDPVELTWHAGALEVSSLVLKGPTTELNAAGRWGPVTVDLKTQGSLDLRLLSSLTSQVERASGQLDFTAAFDGTVENPSLGGTASLSDTRFQVAGQDLAVRSLSGRADFSESRVIIQDVEGFLNEGRLRSRGDIRLEHFKVKSLEVQTDVEDVTVQVQPDVPATFTGSLLLASRNGEQFQLSGGLDVVKFRYTRDFVLRGESETPSDSRPDEWLRLDVDLRTAGDVRIESKLVGVPVLGDGRVDARLNGHLKLSGTNVKPVLIGVVETEQDSQAVFRATNFNVQRGQFQFNGLWPTVDVSAQSQVGEYLVSVKAFGRLDDPKVSLSSDPQLPYPDIMSLLLVGVTSREGLTQGAGVGLAAEAFLSVSGLGQQVQRFLSKSSGPFKDPQVKLTTSFNEATGTSEPAVTLESKVVSDSLKVGVTKPVAGRGTKAHLEYRINQRVSARAQWDDQNQLTTVGNPGVEMRFRFEWE